MTGQEAHDKVLKIMSIWGNANQYHNEVALHTNYNIGCTQKGWQYQVLVGIYDGKATSNNWGERSIYLWERVCKQGEGQSDKERESQVDSAEFDPEIKTWAKIKNWMGTAASESSLVVK